MKAKYPFVIRLARLTYGKILKKKCGITYTNETNIDLSEGPYLLVSNHCGAYDPLIISTVMPLHVRWVTGAYLFKTGFLNFIFSKLCKCIAKQQGQKDFTTVRSIQKALRNGDVVGLFPEGTRTWDGNMMPVSYKPLAKMARMFKAPIVIANLEGCFAQQPRWADTYRKSIGINVNFKRLITAEEIADMSLEELVSQLDDGLNFSNDRWKEKSKYRIAEDKRAEGIQRMFYMCPECKKIGTMVSDGNEVRCSSCGVSARITDNDNIESDKIDFKTYSQWHDWEAGQLAKVTDFKEEEGVLLQTGSTDNNSKLETISKNIKVKMSDNKIVVATEDAGKYTIDYEDIVSITINAKQTLEIVCRNNDVFRIRLLPDSSSLKYQEHFLKYAEAHKE